jgi:hypothetical protein
MPGYNAVIAQLVGKIGSMGHRVGPAKAGDAGANVLLLLPAADQGVK